MSSSSSEPSRVLDEELQPKRPFSKKESNIYFPLKYSTTPEMANLNNEISVLSPDNRATLDKRSAEVLICNYLFHFLILLFTESFVY